MRKSEFVKHTNEVLGVIVHLILKRKKSEFLCEEEISNDDG